MSHGSSLFGDSLHAPETRKILAAYRTRPQRRNECSLQGTHVSGEVRTKLGAERTSLVLFRHRFPRAVLGCISHYMISVELCSGLVKALARLDPAGFGLDDSSTPTRWDTCVGDPAPARSSKVAPM